MNGHLRTFSIDGINLDDLEFNWNDKLIIFHNKESNDNIVNVHVILPEPYINRPLGEPVSEREFEQQGIANEMVSTFLACYHLTNDLNMPKILKTSWCATDIKQFETMEEIKTSGFISQEKTGFEQNIDKNYTLEALNNTKPLFEKLMNLPEKTRKQISIALIVYQNVRASDEIFLQFLGLITVLEILFVSNNEPKRKRASSRTSAFYKKDESDRIELNKKLREIYKDRNDLAHGSAVSLNPQSSYHKHYDFLLPIVFQILPSYIENLSQGKTKKEINKILDNIFFDDSV